MEVQEINHQALPNWRFIAPNYNTSVSPPVDLSIDVLPSGLAIDPSTWTRQNVYYWLEWCVENFSLPSVDLEQFHMNGRALCLLLKSDFRERVPSCGDVLYNVLQKILQNLSSTQSSPSQMSLDSTEAEELQPLELWKNGHEEAASHNRSIEIQAGPTRTPSPPSRTHHISNLSNDLGIPQNVLRLRNGYRQIIVDKITNRVTPTSSPIPINRPLIDSLQEPSTEKINVRLLWDFLQQLLNEPQQRYKHCIMWKDKSKGVFKITDPHVLASLWGVQKNHLNMNFDKMSRALRYYYRVNILQKEPGEKHCYRFLRLPSELRHCKQRSLLLKDSEAAIDMSIKEEGITDPD